MPVYLLYEISIWIVAGIEAAKAKQEKAEADALAAGGPPAP